MKAKFFLIGLLLCIAFSSFSQTITVAGKVSDSKSSPLVGVNVLIKNSGKGTITDFNGEYKINTEQGDTLIFSYIGFQTIEIVVSNATAHITLVEISEHLDQVVIVGYGIAKKSDLTGSIATIKSDEIINKPNTNPVATIQGKVAGLSVVNEGKLGGEPDVRIRGTVSRYHTKPLYVVDGIFVDNIRFLNPQDIKSMEVLKDPSSLAIFGIRGANGVIIVSTNSAKKEALDIKYSYSFGLKQITNKPSFTNAAEFKTLYDEQLSNAGLPPYQHYDKFTGNTDWIDELSNNGASIITHNMSIAKGSKTNKIFFSLGYHKEEGLIKYEETDKLTTRLQTESQLLDNIKIGAGISWTHTDLPHQRGFGEALKATPIVDAYNEEKGLYNQLPDGMGSTQIWNPLQDIEEIKRTKFKYKSEFLPNAFLEVKFLEDFKLKAAFYGNLQYEKERSYSPIFDVYVTETDEIIKRGNDNTTTVSQFKADYYKFQQDYTLTYSKKLEKHNVTGLLGHVRNTEKSEALGVSVNQYLDGTPIPNDPRLWYATVSPFGDPTSSSLQYSDTRNPEDYSPKQWDEATTSYLIRGLYDYDNKYIVNLSYRIDRTSRLVNNRTQHSWAIGTAWEMTKENFMKDQQIFDFVKIKGSIGSIGNEFTQLHYPQYPVYIEGQSAVFGGELVPAYSLLFRPNPDLDWEKVMSIEGGFELAVLKNKLKFEAVYFSKKTKDLLAFVEKDNDKFYTNAGEIKNNGLELSASWTDQFNDNWAYSVNGNATLLRNKVESVYEPGYTVHQSPSILKTGEPIGSFYGYEVEGVYQSNKDIEDSPESTLGTYGPGDLKFKDINGDGKITPDDRTIIGNPNPDLTYGISANIRYKNFSLGVDCQGVYGNEIYRNWGNGADYTQFNYRTDRLNRWTGPGTSNWEPRVHGASGYNINNPSNYMIENGSYFRIRNIRLAYDLDEKIIEKLKSIKLKSLGIYINAQNPITFSKVSGFTPEAAGSPISFGVDYGGYPLPAIYSLGVNIGF